MIFEGFFAHQHRKCYHLVCVGQIVGARERKEVGFLVPLVPSLRGTMASFLTGPPAPPLRATRHSCAAVAADAAPAGNCTASTAVALGKQVSPEATAAGASVGVGTWLGTYLCHHGRAVCVTEQALRTC